MLRKPLWIGISALILSAPAQSQNLMEEIVVTAQKREQTLQEVPVAVSVTDAETIDKAQILDVQDLQTVVPSLRITQLQSSANTNFVIRGFGNGANNAGIEPSVGVFIDGVYRSRSASALNDLPNLERIEVLRGPQSTLFGKNASAGVISVVTAAPDTQEFGGSVTGTVGRFGQIVAKGNITGPISDKVAFSLSANVHNRDGYFDELRSGGEFNERDRWGVRGQLLIEPTDTSSFRIIADYDNYDEICCGTSNLVNGPTGGAVLALGGNLVGDDPFSRETFANFDSTNDITLKGISMQADFDIGDNGTLTSITAYREQESETLQDIDFTSADIIGPGPGSANIETFTQEIRFASTIGEDIDWMIGGFYFDEDVNQQGSVTFGPVFYDYANILTGGAIPGVEALLGFPSRTFYSEGAGAFETSGQKNEAWSIFGTMDWHFNERTTLTLGFNYTEDKKDAFLSQVNTDVFSSLDFVQIIFGATFGALTGLPPTPDNIAMNPAAAGVATFASTTNCSAAAPPPGCNPLLPLQPLQFLPPMVNFPNAVEDGRSRDDEFTYTVRLAYDVNDNINVYGSYATGFKATSWNLSRDSRPFPSDIAALAAAGLTQPNLVSGTRFAGPEEAKVWEFGVKGQFDRGAFNLTVFDQEIDGFQSNLFVGTGFVLANAGVQSTFGVEMDATFFPVDPLQLTFAATWLDPEYDSFPGAQGVNGPVDLSGETPSGIHEWSIVTTATYTHDFANGMSGFIRGEYLYEDEVQIVDNVPASIASREVSVLNASLGLQTESGWDLTLWARNLTNDNYLLSAFPTVIQGGSFNGYPNQPRTYGLTVRKHF